MLGNMNYNQNGYYDYNSSGTVTRKAIVDYMKASLGTENVVSVDEFETMKARHVCKNSKIKKIVLLDLTFQLLRGMFQLRFSGVRNVGS